MMEPYEVQNITVNIMLKNKLNEKKEKKRKISFKFRQVQLVFVAI